jgi:hypothetical protein
MAQPNRLNEGKSERNPQDFRKGFEAISFKDKKSSGKEVAKADLPSGVRARITYPGK